MNLILFEKDEVGCPLARHDRRAEHIIKVLRCKVGDNIRVGIINGAQGTAEITAIKQHALTIQMEDTLIAQQAATDDEKSSKKLCAVDMLIGLPRPPVIRRLLRDLTTIGVARVFLYAAKRSEKSYYCSRHLQPQAIRAALLEGASQGGVTVIPQVYIYRHIEELFTARKKELHATDNKVLLLTPQEASMVDCNPVHFISYLTTDHVKQRDRLLIAIGPERGWELSELQRFTASAFCPAELGRRTLRTENVATAAALMATQCMAETPY